jgi:hypothetical protein
LKEPLAVLDLAPEKIRGVGGKIPFAFQGKEKIHYLSPLILPPRLSGKNEEDIRRIARENRQRIDGALQNCIGKNISIWLMNDVTLYLHDGQAEELFSIIADIPTVVMNGYYGRYFGESPLSRRERMEMENLMSRCDRVIFLPPTTPLTHLSPFFTPS